MYLPFQDGGYFESHFESGGAQSWMREAGAADLADDRTCGFYRQRLFAGIVCVADLPPVQSDWAG